MTSAPRAQSEAEAETKPPPSKISLVRCCCIAINVVLAVLYCARLYAMHSSVASARIFHDSEFYFKLAKSSLFSGEIWAGERAAIPVLWFKASALDGQAIRRSFAVFGAVSWIAFASTLAVSCKSTWARKLAPAPVYAVALTLNVVQWNEVVLSESLSHSFFALFTAAALMFISRRGYWAAPLAFLAAVLAFCRDSNAYFILFCGIALVATAAYRFRIRAVWRHHAVMGLVFVAIFALSNSASNAGARWEYPLANVLFTRILPDKNAVAEFRGLGMPVSGALRAGRARRAYDRDPRLKSFYEWLRTHGKKAYVRFLLAHPVFALASPDLSAVLGGDLREYQPLGIQGERSFLDVIWSKTLWPWHLALVAALGCIAASLRAGSSPLVLGLTYTALLYPHAILVWHADSMEVARHGAPVSLQLQVALVLVLVGLFDGSAKRAKPVKQIVHDGGHCC